MRPLPVKLAVGQKCCRWQVLRTSTQSSSFVWNSRIAPLRTNTTVFTVCSRRIETSTGYYHIDITMFLYATFCESAHLAFPFFVDERSPHLSRGFRRLPRKWLRFAKMDYFFGRWRFRSRTPEPPPFSSINSTPATSKARLIASSLAAVRDVPFSATSARLIVFTPTERFPRQIDCTPP